MKCKICGSESGSYPLCRTCYAKREAGEIIKCVKCGSWHYAGSPCHCEEGFQASRTSSEAELPFLYEAKPSLVTKTETAYLNCIKSFLPDTCLIQAQANLASFIRRTDGAKYQNDLFRNVDFIITDLSYRPLLVIEINDQTHRLPERRERDKKVACICEEAGIPLIKLWTSYGVNEEYIKKKITQTLASLPVERIHHFAPVHEETAQPVLESPLPGASAASSSHAAPKQPQTSAHKQTQPASQKEGCYIATCVYGSYDCPQVRLLRRFRDEHMKKTPAGRIFIRLYYAVSPVLVRCFGKNPAFHVFWRHILDSLIRRLESGR